MYPVLDFLFRAGSELVWGRSSSLDGNINQPGDTWDWVGSEYVMRSLMGRDWSRDLDTGLWWAISDLATFILASDGQKWSCDLDTDLLFAVWWWQHRMPQHHLVSGLGAMQHWSTSGVNIKHIEASPFRRFPTAKQTQGYIDKSWFWQVQMLSNFSVQSDLVRHDMRHLITLIFFFQLIRLFRNIETWFL